MDTLASVSLLTGFKDSLMYNRPEKRLSKRRK